jgi:hypothetical protein
MITSTECEREEACPNPGPLLQPVLGTDKGNPIFSVCRQVGAAPSLPVYYGAEWLEVVPEDRRHPAFKLLIARLYNAGTWAGSEALLASCFFCIPTDIREVRVRTDAGFGFHPVLALLEQWAAQYAVVARLTSAFKRVLGGLRYHRLNARWEIAECQHRLTGWPCARRCIVARRKMEETEPEPTLFVLDRYLYRAWFTNRSLTPAGIWNFYEGRAGMEPRIRQLREDYALRKIPTRAFAANALYLEIVRLAYNLVTAFQRTCLPEDWQSLTLNKLRHRLFWLPGELTRPQNRPTLRLPNRPAIQEWTTHILRQVHKLKPLEA